MRVFRGGQGQEERKERERNRREQRERERGGGGHGVVLSFAHSICFGSRGSGGDCGRYSSRWWPGTCRYGVRPVSGSSLKVWELTVDKLAVPGAFSARV